MVITAALVIILSAFNGIEQLIENMYSAFDTDINLSSPARKTFRETEINWKELEKIEGIERFSKGVEEIVVLRHEKKWVNATLVGVEEQHFQSIRINEHLWAGQAIFNENGIDYGVLGVDLLQKLNAKIGDGEDIERLLIYAPKRNMRLRFGKSPFYSDAVLLSGAMNYNKEVNQDNLLWSLNKVRELLRYEDELTHIYFDVKNGFDKEKVKAKIQAVVGADFAVKTNFEKNALIFQTSKSERMVVVIILIFVFILASFNLVASLTMLFIEKKDNIQTLKSVGFTDSDTFKLFFYEGLLISGIGILGGLVLGYLVCWLQLQFSLLVIPGPDMPFPIRFSWGDFLLIVGSVSVLSVLFSYFPTKFMLRANRS